MLRLADQKPADPTAQGQRLQHRDPEKLAIKRLLARLVAKQTASGIGPHSAAQKGQPQQSRFPDPPLPRLSPRLVDPEGGKGDEVDCEQRGGDVGGV